MANYFKLFFTSPDGVVAVCEAVAAELSAGPFSKTPDSLEHFPVFEAKTSELGLSLKRIENRGERGIYRLSGGVEGDTDITDTIITKLYGVGFESLMTADQHEEQFSATQKFNA